MAQPAALFSLDLDTGAGPDALYEAAEATISALRDQNAIQPWHELDCMIVLKLAEAVGQHRGIAKSQLFGSLLQARARLPEPVVQETNVELVEYEAQRVIRWARTGSPQLAAAELPDAPQR